VDGAPVLWVVVGACLITSESAEKQGRASKRDSYKEHYGVARKESALLKS
jgi:hypothetical protein